MKIFKFLVILLAGLVVVYFMGPKASKPELDRSFPKVSQDLKLLAQEIRQMENKVENIKPDNESKIIWADSIPSKTPYCVVYIPGFTATYAEGQPVHRNFASRYGCNLYLPRLDGFGLNDVDALQTLSAERMVESAQHALSVGKQLGEKVILMSTSTGGTLSLILAAQDPDITALIMYSPNIALYDSKAWLLTAPWGLRIAQLVTGSKYRQYDQTEEYKKYWYTKYRLEGAVALQALLETTMNPETFSKINQPLFMGYYYKSEEEKDEVVSIPAMLKMYKQISTPESKKRKVAFSTVGHHALASYLTSEDTDTVEQETYKYVEEVLGMEPLKKN